MKRSTKTTTCKLQAKGSLKFEPAINSLQQIFGLKSMWLDQRLAPARAKPFSMHRFSALRFKIYFNWDSMLLGNSISLDALEACKAPLMPNSKLHKKISATSISL